MIEGPHFESVVEGAEEVVIKPGLPLVGNELPK